MGGGVPALGFLLLIWPRGGGTYLGVPTPPILTWRGRDTYLGWEGVPTLGYPSPYSDMARGGGGIPTLDRGRVPTLGYPPPDLARGKGVPTLDRGRGTYLGIPPVLTWPGGRGYLPWTGGGVPTLGYPRPDRARGKGVPTLDEGQRTYTCENIAFPILRMLAGIKGTVQMNILVNG